LNGPCIPERPGGACVYCGRTLRDDGLPEISLETALAILRESGGRIDPDDPNYWIYLMHDIEIVAEPIKAPTNAGLAFYGTRPNRKRGKGRHLHNVRDPRQDSAT
jgi:hypothetical protein